ncbi:helix-turn-helix domain-containing protein [uncultured Tenacibaculum sp.]|uniref:helix-turn-helix domain-containing protein n=1 Tax=uncultured Tenacibaculum sp. TaxID=174713 RepID=UPI00260CA819|nr:helix-turn-helix domain-containing protein [uncultured Tenacibaculum sp.]
MQLSELFNLFLIVSAIHGFAFFFFLLKKKTKNRGILFLSLMILAIALNNLQSWLLIKEFFILKYIQIPWHLLIAPFFYVFLLHYLDIKKKFFNVLKFIIPLFFISIIFQVVYLSFIKDVKSDADYSLFYEKYTAIEEVISLLISLILFYYSYSTLKYKSHLFKEVLSFDNLKWLNSFIYLGGITYILWSVALIVKFYLNFDNFIVFYYPLRVMTTLLIYWLGYELIFVLKQVKERKSIREKIIAKPQKEKQNTSQKFIQITSYITDNRRFLDNLLSLETLANELQISSSQLSKVINEETSQNFNHLINNYRVEFSKQLLLDPEYNNYTITSIALESGFNSKSTFYNAFKKHTGITPTNFRVQNS